MLRDNGPQRPQHRVSVLWRCTDATQPYRWVTNRLTGADTGLPVLGLRTGSRLMVIDREKNVGEPLAHFRFSALFENTDFLTGSFSLITVV